MEANKIELQATETLLQRGVRVRVRAPLFLRIFQKRSVEIVLRSPTGGALMRMGYWYLHCQLSIDDLKKISIENAMLFNVRYGKYIYRALACLFLVDKRLTWLLLKPYSKWLQESLSVSEALSLLQISILHGGLEDFMITTRLVRSKMITPPKLGQMTKRS
ncbi:hypothetical protein KO02_17450 [Sphingobacterium sp. ML3W]|uniref:hypothetical protein n=1 Tax=Sphingobacterium sp. ML3W TaxID=1538644 RepID=UPI0004F89173|nr:hypothetical protein [Sphingobacterium sp. ML3W]AIM38270.1 hypothetical protein KO02_17450 [Sphingobacterium sp. ML3W]